MKKNKKKNPRFPDYDLITAPESGLITFGTNVWLRKDGQALIIIFPAGQELHFAPADELDRIKNKS